MEWKLPAYQLGHWFPGTSTLCFPERGRHRPAGCSRQGQVALPHGASGAQPGRCQQLLPELADLPALRAVPSKPLGQGMQNGSPASTPGAGQARGSQ